MLGLQALRPHEAREHLDRHGGDHVVAPVGMRRGVVAPRGKHGGDLRAQPTQAKQYEKLGKQFHRMKTKKKIPLCMDVRE